MAAKVNGAGDKLPAPLDHELKLGHKLVNVVVVAVVDAVDVTQPTVPACPLPVAYPPLGEARHLTTMGIRTVAGYCPCPPFEVFSGRSHSETCAGCIVSLTTPTRLPLNASRSVSSLSFAEKASRVFLASYFLR